MDCARIWRWVFVWALVAAVGTGSASAQVAFERTYGGERWECGYSVQQTRDGGYIVAGTTNSFGVGYSDVYVTKTDSLGDTLWTETYGGMDTQEEGKSVQQTWDGGYIVAGTTGPSGYPRSDVYLIKTDSLGATEWTRTYRRGRMNKGHSVQQTTDGGYIIVGEVWHYSSWPDIYLIKADSSGDVQWTRTYGGPDSDCGYSVRQTQDGGYIIAGETWSFGAGENDVYLVKTNSSGDTLWTRTYGSTSQDMGRSVWETSDGGYVVTGFAAFPSTGADIYLMKTDSRGHTEWTRIYGSEGINVGHSVQQTRDGGYIVTGWWRDFPVWPGDAYLMKTDSLGDTVWTRTYGGTDEDVGRSVRQTRDGGYIVAGGTMSFGAGRGDVYLVKTAPLLLTGLVTGGGWIAGDPPGPGSKKTFGFNAHSLGEEVWGQLQYIDHATKLKVHSDTVKTLVIHEGDTMADFSGDCRVREHGGQLVLYTFECRVMDRGEPGRGVDWFGLDVYDGNGNLYYSAGDYLGGGNIQVHVELSDGVAGDVSDKRTEFGREPNPRAVRGVLGTARLPVCNTPNPFTDKTTISFHLPSSSHATLEIYDITGRLVATLVDGRLSAGLHTTIWETGDAPAGVYYYKLTAGDFTATRKMVVLK